MPTLPFLFWTIILFIKFFWFQQDLDRACVSLQYFVLGLNLLTRPIIHYHDNYRYFWGTYKEIDSSLLVALTLVEHDSS